MSGAIEVRLLMKTRPFAEEMLQKVKDSKYVLEIKQTYRSPSWMYLDQEKAEKEVYLYAIEAIFKSEYSARKFAKENNTKLHKSYWANKLGDTPHRMYVN